LNKSSNITDDIQSFNILSGTESILLVDDEVNFIFGTERMLKQLGYRVISRTDPLDALDLFRADPEQFDLIITDQTMPHMIGTELARELTRIRPDIPVILCTGNDTALNSDSDDIGETAEFITELALKPLIRGEIAALIRRVLDDAQQHEGPHD
jgi:CheY-like chemotaxis protein